jgi:hypothetical protein
VQSISAGVPQGSILVFLLFLIYVNDVKYNILSCITLIADDTVLIKEIYHPVNDFCELTNDVETINSWSKQWLTLNAEKTNYLIFSEKPNKYTHPLPTLKNVSIKQVLISK